MTYTETPTHGRFKKASLRDVAREAEVSVKTVSWYLGGRTDACSADTGLRIEKAMEKLHYAPNALERGMRLGVTQVIGVSTTPPNEYTKPERDTFVMRLWRGIGMIADEQHRSLLSYPKFVRNGADVRPFLDGRVDGIIFSPGPGDPRPEKIARAGMPIVLIGRRYDVPDGCGAAFANESGTVNLALSHLWDMGHRRIAHIAAGFDDPVDAAHPATKDIGIAECRHASYISWMSKRDRFDPALIGRVAGWDGLGVDDAVGRLYRLSDPPTAIFCSNDNIAIKVIEALKAIGRNVPNDVSVVGVDNVRFEDPALPVLTTVDVPVEEIGKSATEALIAMLGGVPASECRFSIQVTRLVEGATAAPLPRA